MTSDEHDDDRVGYGKPPNHTKFKPGQSGNPRGRRARMNSSSGKSTSEVYARADRSDFQGQKKTVPVVDALIKGAINRALGGCTKHLKVLLDGSGGLKALIAEQKHQDSEFRRKFIEDLRKRLTNGRLVDGGVGDDRRGQHTDARSGEMCQGIIAWLL